MDGTYDVGQMNALSQYHQPAKRGYGWVPKTTRADKALHRWHRTHPFAGEEGMHT